MENKMKSLLIISFIVLSSLVTLAATLSIGSGSVLNVNGPLSSDLTVVQTGGTLTGEGQLTGSLQLAGILKPGFPDLGTFLVQSNFHGQGGILLFDCSDPDTLDSLTVNGISDGSASVQIISSSPTNAPQDKAIVFSGSGSDFTTYSAASGWLVRQEGNDLLLHELNYDTDSDGKSDYYELVTGTDGGNSGDYFDLDALSFTNGLSTIYAAFTSIPDRTYALEYCTNLTGDVWLVHPATPLVGDGSDMSFNEPVSLTEQTFYRIRIERN